MSTKRYGLIDKNKETLSEMHIKEFRDWLFSEGKSGGTVKKYVSDSMQFCDYLKGKEINQENIIKWKDDLLEAGVKATTVNSKIAAINTYCNFSQLNIKIKYCRIQRSIFREESRELSKEEYRRLVSGAREKGDERLALIIETIAATGIRISELKYITVEAVSIGRSQIILKGKIRIVLIPKKLCRKLLLYAKKHKTFEGVIFNTKRGNSISRKQVWSEMKKLARSTQIEESKVFPHNLRHLFAREFYNVSKDMSMLADVLGHSSIETTRIYLMSTEIQHAKILAKMDLLL